MSRVCKEFAADHLSAHTIRHTEHHSSRVAMRAPTVAPDVKATGCAHAGMRANRLGVLDKYAHVLLAGDILVLMAVSS